MKPNAFIGKKEPPTDEELAVALGPAKVVWDRLLSELDREYGVQDRVWKSHSPKWGWSLRVLRKKRTILWLSPRPGCFEVLFILGAKAMQAAAAAKLPQPIVKIMKEAPKYPEGTGVRILMKSAKYLPTIKKLTAIKLAN